MQEDLGSSRSTFNLFGLHLDIRATVILIAGTLLLTVDHYHTFLSQGLLGTFLRVKPVERVGYYLIIPLLIIVLLFRDRPADYGFRVGNWREGLKWTALILGVGFPLLYFSARTPPMVEYYERLGGSTLQVVLNSALDLVGWEFFFRGFILFGLLRIAGPTAVIIQAVPFALAHLGKPELETMSTIFGGTLFGWVAWRSGSFFYPFLIHCGVYITVVLVATAGP
jgi:membrane protease YdiL (CAAX protease family)